MGGHFHDEYFWNKFTFEVEQMGFWKFGPLDLWIKRLSNEWRIWVEYSRDPLDIDFQHSLPFTDSIPSRDKIQMKRFGVKQTDDEIHLTPTLSDRSIVIRPEVPLYILPKEEVELFASLPLWVRIETKDHVLIDEVPVYHLANSWFGDPAGEGELCYSTTLSSKMKLKDLPERFHRAITAIVIQNNSKESVLLERIKIPAPNLSLFKNEHNLFFTQRLTIEREKDGSFDLLYLDQSPHPEAGDAKDIYPARESLRENIITKTLSRFF